MPRYFASRSFLERLKAMICPSDPQFSWAFHRAVELAEKLHAAEMNHAAELALALAESLSKSAPKP